MGGKLRSGSRKAKARSDTAAKQQFLNVPKREPKKATTGEFLGIAFDSLEELAFLQWADDLKKAGYIKSIRRADSYLLCESMTIGYAEQLKTKSKPMQQTILHGHSYNPEFEIIWDKKALDKFVHLIGIPKKHDKAFLGWKRGDEIVTIIEIKPLFDQNNMERLFKVNQKWMWDKHAVFVNLVKCPELFPKTFTPNAYLTTPSGFKRKIKWKIRSLYHYLNG